VRQLCANCRQKAASDLPLPQLRGNEFPMPEFNNGRKLRDYQEVCRAVEGFGFSFTALGF
jgi:hypothetical protein